MKYWSIWKFIHQAKPGFTTHCVRNRDNLLGCYVWNMLRIFEDICKAKIFCGGTVAVAKWKPRPIKISKPRGTPDEMVTGNKCPKTLSHHSPNAKCNWLWGSHSRGNGAIGNLEQVTQILLVSVANYVITWLGVESTNSQIPFPPLQDPGPSKWTDTILGVKDYGNRREIENFPRIELSFPGSAHFSSQYFEAWLGHVRASRLRNDGGEMTVGMDTMCVVWAWSSPACPTSQVRTVSQLSSPGMWSDNSVDTGSHTLTHSKGETFLDF